MAHNQVDEALGRTATVVSDKSTTTGQVWTSVVTTFATEDAEEDLASGTSAPDLTMLKDGDRVTTGSAGRTVATSGNDLLRAGAENHHHDRGAGAGNDHRTAQWDAARRRPGSGRTATRFRSKRSIWWRPSRARNSWWRRRMMGTAVSVTEGVVSVRSTHIEPCLRRRAGPYGHRLVGPWFAADHRGNALRRCIGGPRGCCLRNGRQQQSPSAITRDTW